MSKIIRWFGVAFVAWGVVARPGSTAEFAMLQISDVYVTSVTLRATPSAVASVWQVTLTNFDLGTSITQQFPYPASNKLVLTQAEFSNIKPNSYMQVSQKFGGTDLETQTFFTKPEPACAFQVFSCRPDAVTLAYKNSPDLPANPNPQGSVYRVSATGSGYNQTVSQPWVGPTGISDSNFVTFTGLTANSSYNAVALVKNRSASWSDSDTAQFTFSNVGCVTSGPVITSLSPSSKVTGGAAFNLTISGSNFDPTLAYAEFNGVRKNPLPGSLTTTQMTVAISAPDINLSPRQIPVDVVNPSPSTVPGVSNLLYFTILPTISVTVAPADATLSASETQQFTATVTGTANQNVTWTLSPNVGSVSAAGVYTAPSTIASAQTITIRATSQADSNVSGTAAIHLQPTANTPITVTVTPLTATLSASQQQTFIANVSGSANQSVTWSLSQSGMGTLSGAGLFTAPASIGSTTTVNVIAHSVADPTKSGQATVTLIPTSAGVGTVQTPTITPNGGTFTGSVSVTISVATVGATIRYTLDGSNPTSNSTIYNGALTLSANTTVKAYATKAAMNDSAIATANFTILIPTVVPPHLTSLVPNSAPAGFADFDMVVNGTGFDLTSAVRWNGSALATTFDTASRLIARVLSANVAVIGTASVDVLNSAGSGGASDNALTFTINNGGGAPSAPWVVNQPSASPNPVNGTASTQLSALGGTYTNNGDESVLRYAWTITGPAAVTLTSNGDNAAKNAGATFRKIGTYTFNLRITDSVTQFSVDAQALQVFVNPGVGGIVVTPKLVSLQPGEPFNFTATVVDQFGNPFANTVTWTATGGAISANSGHYTAPNVGASITITASSGGKSDSAVVTIVIDAAAAGGDLSNAKVGPVPFKANSGDPGVTFRNLPTGTQIRLFTMGGRIVQTIQVPNGGDQLWDLTNANFEKVASGVYLYSIESGGQKKEGKLVIIK